MDGGAVVVAARVTDLSLSAFAGEALFDGCMAIAQWPREDVAQILPAEIELAAGASVTPMLHPVAFVFGEQRSARATAFPLPISVDYGEWAILIPFVRRRGATRLHSYAARMYSTYFPPVWDGNMRYGFAKRIARLWRQGAMFVLTDEQGTLLMHAAIEPSGPWATADRGNLAGFAVMQETFALPILGRKQDGTYVSSFFGWDFQEATVRPVRSWIAIDAPVLPEVVAGSTRDAASAFEVRGMHWRLSWPSSYRF